MALDATSREANLRDSLKKFFVDNLARTEKLALTFDKALSTPRVQGNEVVKWVAVQFGDLQIEHVSQHVIQVFCCTRQDPEGYKLSRLRDKVFGYLTDNSNTDGLRRITLYKTNVKPWVSIGGILVFPGSESGQGYSSDETKYKVIPVNLKWAAKV